jgi:hypothetical protein
MRYQYIVILKKTSARATDAFSLLLCLFSAITFGYRSFTAGHINYLALVLAIALLAGPATTLIIRAKNGTAVRYRIWLLAAAIGWIGLTPTPWVGAFYFVLAFLEAQTKRPLEIGFDQDLVVINTLIKRRFDWSMFNNVVLKDGLLTLDFKDNRLLQKEVADDEDDDDVDEEEFNAWCRSKILLWNKKDFAS